MQKGREFSKEWKVKTKKEGQNKQASNILSLAVCNGIAQ